MIKLGHFAFTSVACVALGYTLAVAFLPQQSRLNLTHPVAAKFDTVLKTPNSLTHKLITGNATVSSEYGYLIVSDLSPAKIQFIGWNVSNILSREKIRVRLVIKKGFSTNEVMQFQIKYPDKNTENLHIFNISVVNGRVTPYRGATVDSYALATNGNNWIVDLLTVAPPGYHGTMALILAPAVGTNGVGSVFVKSIAVMME